jgi:hypothetical protein
LIARQLIIGQLFRHEQAGRRRIDGPDNGPPHIGKAHEGLARPESANEPPQAFVRIWNVALQATDRGLVDLVDDPVVDKPEHVIRQVIRRLG